MDLNFQWNIFAHEYFYVHCFNRLNMLSFSIRILHKLSVTMQYMLCCWLHSLQRIDWLSVNERRCHGTSCCSQTTNIGGHEYCFYINWEVVWKKSKFTPAHRPSCVCAAWWESRVSCTYRKCNQHRKKHFIRMKWYGITTMAWRWKWHGVGATR